MFFEIFVSSAEKNRTGSGWVNKQLTDCACDQCDHLAPKKGARNDRKQLLQAELEECFLPSCPATPAIFPSAQEAVFGENQSKQVRWDICTAVQN